MLRPRKCPIYLELWGKLSLYTYLTLVRHVSESPGPLRSRQNVICHCHASCMIRRCRLAKSSTFSEYSRLFRWPHRKMAKGTSLPILVVIPVTLSFIPSDLGTVDPTNHIQALHDPPLRCNFKQTEFPVVYFKSLTSLLCSVNHNKLTFISGYEDCRF